MTAPNWKIPQRCTSCSSDQTLWLRQPPDFWHAFRVECRQNHHFLKWASEGQLVEARRRGLDVAEVPYDQNTQNRAFLELRTIKREINVQGRHHFLK